MASSAAVSAESPLVILTSTSFMSVMSALVLESVEEIYNNKINQYSSKIILLKLRKNKDKSWLRRDVEQLIVSLNV